MSQRNGGTININMSAITSGDVRNDMKRLWDVFSSQTNANGMMQETDATVLSLADVEEITSFLPNLKGKRILELGAGIGRYTAVLAKSCDLLTAVDFMASFVEKNRELNGHNKNIDFIAADAMSLEFSPNSYDFIFINWLFMYLSDLEVHKLVGRFLCWLKEGGLVFYRESCFYPGGDVVGTLKENPTRYRSTQEYNSMFQSTNLSPDGTSSGQTGYELIFCKMLQCYVKLRNKRNQYCWLWQTARRDVHANHGFATLQEFLDNKQYTLKGILRYEKVFGDGYISIGGAEATEEFLELLDLKEGQLVLDVGCGIGGGDFYMAKKYGVCVDAIDLSSNVVEIAMDRASEHPDLKVRFEIGDIAKRQHKAGSFDAIYSKDTFQHIKDKPDVFRRFLTWLKPGGKLLVSSYCCGEPPFSEDFEAYVAERGYTLYTPKQHGEFLEAAGFVNVKAEDRTWQFKAMLQKELARMTDETQTILEGFTEENEKALLESWKSEMELVDTGNQKWGLLYAEKAV